MDVKSLNCNNESGNVITEATARVQFYNKTDTIANIYAQSRVLDEQGRLCGFVIDGTPAPRERAKEFYNALWWEFFRENPDVLSEILRYEEYEDGAPEGAANSPARVFRLVKAYGNNGLGSNCKDFLVWLKNERDRNTNPFATAKRNAEQSVRELFDSFDKEEIMKRIEDIFGEPTRRIASLVYEKKTGAITDFLYSHMLKKIKEEMEEEQE